MAGTHSEFDIGAFVLNISPNAGICSAPIRDPVRRSRPWSGRSPFALLMASPRVMILSCREYAFADAGNLEHCAKYLNQTLVTFGFPASLDLFATDPVRFTCIISDISFLYEAKNTANLKAQIEKLQQERDEFQKMVIGNQVFFPLDNVDAYEVKKKELMAENSDLRALLRSMQVKNCNNKIISRLTWSTRTVADAHTSLFEIAIHEHDMDMRYFLNAPNGLPQQTSAVNEKEDAGSPQSPLGGRMVG
ncbi:hypothetical protein BHE74_00005146 [Ensete ventricosum]|nr:hypothetical protein BHE74_00005146 [Ensete ventricosum]RZR83432.1 hypothetical protein BHM03_00010034 [Ensete ventricosum]